MSKKIKIRDQRKKGFFVVDNEYLNGYAKHLGPTTTAIYFALCRHADLTSQSCFPSQATIANELGIGRRTVIFHIKKLVEYNIIQVERKKRGRKWDHNVYFLLDKSEWKAVGAKSAHTKNEQVGAESCKKQVQNLHTKETHNKETHITTANQRFADSDLIVKVIDLFVEFNPSCKKFYANKTQRSAISRLLELHGFEQLSRVIQLLPKTNEMQYMPTITTPLQLEDKWASLEANLKKKRSEIEELKNKHKIAFV